MATLRYLNKADATQDMTFNTLISGTVSSDATVKNSGLASYKCAANATTDASFIGGFVGDAGTRESFFFMFDTLPAAEAAIAGLLNASLAFVYNLSLRTDGTLNSNPVGAPSVAGTTVLTTNTWYRLAIGYTITSTTVFTFNVYINGNLEISITSNGTLTGTGTTYSSYELAKAAGTANAWFDSIYVDNGTNNGDPGNILVTAKRPFANGTTNGFTTQIGSGSSGYGSGHALQVNERPLSQTNGWSMVGAGAIVTEEYNVEASTVGDINLVESALFGYMGWIWAKSTGSQTASIILNNVAANAALTTTAKVFVAFSNTTTYTGRAGKDIGIKTTTALQTVSLYECGILFAYFASPQGKTIFLNQAPNRASTY